MTLNTLGSIEDIYAYLDEHRTRADMHIVLDGLQNVIRELSEKQAVIRTVNGEIDDVWIENVDVHLERMDRDEWSLILYRGDERVAFSIGLDTVNVPVPRLRDGALMIVVNATLNDDTIGIVREEQGE